MLGSVGKVLRGEDEAEFPVEVISDLNIELPVGSLEYLVGLATEREG